MLRACVHACKVVVQDGAICHYARCRWVMDVGMRRAAPAPSQDCCTDSEKMPSRWAKRSPNENGVCAHAGYRGGVYACTIMKSLALTMHGPPSQSGGGVPSRYRCSHSSSCILLPACVHERECGAALIQEPRNTAVLLPVPRCTASLCSWLSSGTGGCQRCAPVLDDEPCHSTPLSALMQTPCLMHAMCSTHSCQALRQTRLARTIRPPPSSPAQGQDSEAADP